MKRYISLLVIALLLTSLWIPSVSAEEKTSTDITKT